MEITVKVLQGQELSLKVTNEATVADVKNQVCTKIGVAPDQQRVVFKGKALQDNFRLMESGVISGSKLFITVKKAAATVTTSATKIPQKSTNTPLWEEMSKFLQRHFTDTDAKKVLDKMRDHYNARLNNLSLDDIERLAHLNLEAMKDSSR